jgi:hypothetical protein
MLLTSLAVSHSRRTCPSPPTAVNEARVTAANARLTLSKMIKAIRIKVV